MINVTALNRSYGNLRAVNNVTFAIQQGEVIGLLGPNGAGKTTIMKMLCGYLEPSSGSITLNDIDVVDNLKAAQAQVGYLPENLPVYPEMTVVAYLEYAAGLKGVAPGAVASELKRVVEATDLNAKALAKISSLSRGLKQRVGVAQALLGNPKVLVLDEPTNGLDPTQTQQMRSLIRRLAQTTTVILSTHILSEVEAVCDRVLMVKSGSLVLDERLDRLQQGSAVLLHTSLPEAALREALAGLDLSQIEVQGVDGLQHARLSTGLRASDDIRTLLGAIARCIISAGGELYQLGFEQRDLESLFRDALNKGGLAHAA